MAQVPANSGQTVLKWILARPYSLLGVILLVVLAFPVFLRKGQDWEGVYVPAAARMQQGIPILYMEYVYPPINAWLALPFVDLPRLPTRALWYAINMTALSVLLLGSWKLSGGGRLEGSPPFPWRERAIFWLGLLCGLSSCIDSITNQQTDLIVGALCIAGCLALVQARSLRAAVWFGVAAGIKCTPLLFAPYLAWKKQWAASALVVVVAVGVNLIPDLTHPPQESSTRLETWARRTLLPMADRKHEFGSWACGIGGNQSVPGLFHRWLVYDPVWAGEELIGAASESRVAPETLKVVTLSSMLLLAALGLASSWKASAGATTPGAASSTAGFELGMVLILMVLLSPHSSKPHFCTLFLPGFCVARAAVNWPNRRLLVVLLVGLACAQASNNDLVGYWLYSWSKWHGTLAWCAVLLYVASCRVLLANRAVAAREEKPAIEAEPMRQAA